MRRESQDLSTAIPREQTGKIATARLHIEGLRRACGARNAPRDARRYQEAAVRGELFPAHVCHTAKSLANIPRCAQSSFHTDDRGIGWLAAFALISAMSVEAFW